MEKPTGPRLSPVRVEGSSMEPTLPAGALVAVSGRVNDVGTGAVVVVRRSGAREDVKRVAAGPGERFLLANGTALTLASNEYAVAGDNASASSDSRHYGPVTRDEIVAVARLCYWPPRAWKWFGRG